MRQLCVAKWWWVVILWENNSIHRINLQRLGISLRQEMVKIPLCVCIKKKTVTDGENILTGGHYLVICLLLVFLCVTDGTVPQEQQGLVFKSGLG